METAVLQKTGSSKLSETTWSFIIPGILLLLGFILIAIYSICTLPHWTTVLSLISMIMLASFSVGALIGFIFGIPRTSQEDVKKGVQSNSNLEQLSDWLTKIIVGVGLVEFKDIFTLVSKLSTDLSSGLSTSMSYAMVSSTLVFYFFGGFFISYIWSRIFLERIFKKDREDTENRISQLEETKNLQVEIEDLKKNYSEENARSILESVLKNPKDPNEPINVFDKIIAVAYQKADYLSINQLTIEYDKKIRIAAVTWTDIAIANMNLFHVSKDKIYYDSVLYAADRAIIMMPDYGTPYMTKLYAELIEFDASRERDIPNELQIIRENIIRITEAILKQDSIAAYEAISYFYANAAGAWGKYNELLKNEFSSEFNSLNNRYEQHLLKGKPLSK